MGSVDSLKGTLNDVPYDIFCMKESHYVIKIVMTYELENDWQKESVKKYTDGNEEKTETFYKITFPNNFGYIHCVNSHNGIRHQVPSLEQTWTTHRWATMVFSFLVAVTDVNCYMIFRYFLWDDDNTLGFMASCSNLARALIANNFKKICDKPSVHGEKEKGRFCSPDTATATKAAAKATADATGSDTATDMETSDRLKSKPWNKQAMTTARPDKTHGDTTVEKGSITQERPRKQIYQHLETEGPTEGSRTHL